MAYEVLFVCTGNVCRSPAAERLLRRDLDEMAGGFGGLSGVHISSAGTGALVGEPISPPMASLVAGGRRRPGPVRGSPAVARHRPRCGPRHHDDQCPPAGDRHHGAGGGPADLRAGGDGADARGGRGRRGVSARRGEGLHRGTTASDGRAGQAAPHSRVDPAEDIVDPYGRPASVYAQSFAQIQAALAPLVRVLTAESRRSG